MPDEVIAGRYRLLEPLGRGSMSSVWAAQDEELGRRVAVKMLAPSAERQRFEREARAAAALAHPNIVSLYDYGESGGRPFMVLECLEGGSLEDRLRDDTPVGDDEARRIAIDVAAGLAHAHGRGLVHRDLKPANILFDSEGRAKIADFGIARMRGTGTLTEAGTVLGTASYISPEQATGLAAGPASDVYSFGVILFRMLTGRLPFVSTNAMELVRMHRDDAPPAISELRPDAPPVLEAVATAALAKDPVDRPADGAAVLAELRGGDSTATGIAAPAAAADELHVLPPVEPRSRRRRAPVVPAAIAALALLLGGGVLALALTNDGNGGGSPSLPGLSLPTVPATGSSSVTSAPATTTAPATTATATTTAPSTTAPATTAPTTAAATTTTSPPTTTVPITSAPPPTTTVAPPTTTAATTTADTTTAPTTTAP
ncbi:MAG: serine/threonine-protein kinase [Gaiellaceae bacterium]